MAEALRLADALLKHLGGNTATQAAGELRRLHSQNERIAPLAERVLELKAQRDALLAALKAAEPHLRHADVHYNVYVQCRAVIAAVEGEKT